MVQNKNQKGFTLIDTLVAITLLGVAALALGLVYPGLKASRSAQDIVLADSIVQKTMEVFRATPFEQLETGEGTIDDPNLARLSNGTGQYRLSLYQDELIMAEVSVNWGPGQSYQRQAVTLIYENGLGR
jgi:prepilin-type N-terminal cleavage/methylation domain-containing protein